MRTSEKTDQIVTALVKVQSEIKMALKKTSGQVSNRVVKYADFASVVEASRPALVKHGLAIVQGAEIREFGWILVTRLAHVSDQWYESEFPLVAKDNSAQAMGSALTYAKRYSWTTMVGVVSEDEDDDGNRASKTPKSKNAIVMPNQNTEKMNGTMARIDQNKKSIPEARSGNKNAFTAVSAQNLKLAEILAKQLGWDAETMRQEFRAVTGKDTSSQWNTQDYDNVMGFMNRKIKTKNVAVPSGPFFEEMT